MTDSPTPPRPASRAELVGTLLADRYRFERLIATGGMAQVWEATDLVLDRRVAVKLLHAHLAEDRSFVDRFRREAVAAARLAHPAIVSIFDTYSGEGMEAIVMELVHGITLRQKLDRHNGLPPAEVVRIGAQVADALAVAHQSRLVHRDIKPANILLCDDDRVMVADFGIAKLDEGGDHTKEGTMLGTAKYLSPEQVEGRPVDARTDVYSLGVVLYEMLCARPPFDADTDVATALARLHADPPRTRQVRADLPRELDDVVMRALARRPDDRYDSAAELRAALRAANLGDQGPEGFSDHVGADHTAVSAVTPPRGTPAALPLAPPPAAPPQPSFVQKERSLLFPALVVIFVAAALAVAGVLIGNTLADRGVIGGSDTTPPDSTGPSPTTALTVAQVAPFDPQGDDGAENDSSAPLAIDGDPDSAWVTETYSTAEFGGLKDGVGLVVSLDTASDLATLTVTSPSPGWSAEVYVADQAAGDLAGWGQPVAVGEVAAGGTPFDLGGSRGAAILLWITRLPESGRAEISDIAVSA